MNDLSHLSLQRVTGHRHPRVLTNEQRMKALRPFLPVEFGNPLFPDVTDDREPVLPDGYTAPTDPIQF